MESGITSEFNRSAFRHGCTQDDINKAFETFCYDGDIIPGMTDQEAAALDEKWTNNPPKVGENGSGFFARRKEAHLIEVDDFSSDYLSTKAVAESKTAKQLVRELISAQLINEAV